MLKNRSVGVIQVSSRSHGTRFFITACAGGGTGGGWSDQGMFCAPDWGAKAAPQRLSSIVLATALLPTNTSRRWSCSTGGSSRGLAKMTLTAQWLASVQLGAN